jgi:hypothetical protein
MSTERQITGATSHIPARREDQEIQRQVREVLASEALLGDCCVDPGEFSEPHGAAVLFPEGFGGLIGVNVLGGVVMLDGEVASLEEKELAGVLPWRVPGCRGVVNSLVVLSPVAAPSPQGA